MEIKTKYGKKGFAFSFFVLFLSILIFAYINMSMGTDDFLQDEGFIKSRVTGINEELSYFKESYIKDVTSYSFQSTLHEILNGTKNKNLYTKYKGNFSEFKNFIIEGMINESLDGISNNFLKNKSIIYFYKEFKQDFDSYSDLNFTFEIIEMNIYETIPYYLDIHILANYTIITDDNISSWNSLDDYVVTVPIYGLPDPSYLFTDDKKVVIRSSEYELGSQQRNLENFNLTINNSYSTVVLEGNHRYTLGSSFLKRLFNITYGSYKNVTAFWSFDYDETEKGVYDTSLNYNLGKAYGVSKLLVDFNKENIIGNNLFDKTNYKHNATIVPNNCKSNGIVNTSCFMNADIIFNNLKINSTDLSMFFWVNINDLSTDVKIFDIGSNNLIINKDGTVKLSLNPKNNGGITELNFEDVNVSKNSWTHIGFIYDGINNKTSLYVDSTKFLSKQSDILYGTVPWSGEVDFSGNLKINSGNYFIDELGIYSRILEIEEVAKLYSDRKILDLNYVNSLQGKGFLFDGKEGFVNLTKNKLNDKDITQEIWFKPENITNKQFIIDSNFDGNGWGIYLQDKKIYFGNNVNYVVSDEEIIDMNNVWYNLVIYGGNSASIPKMYLNGKKVSSTVNGANPKFQGANDLIVGKKYSENKNNFRGVVDEIKFTKRELTSKELDFNYYNFASFAKGCCNYISLVNPNKLEYNDNAHKNNISYSSKLFYDFYNKGIDYKIQLWRLDKITELTDKNKNYYNFLMDACIMDAFGIDNYLEQDGVHNEIYYSENVYENNCSKIVSAGIY